MTMQEIRCALENAIKTVQQMNDHLSDDDQNADEVADLLMDLRNALSSANRIV